MASRVLATAISLLRAISASPLSIAHDELRNVLNTGMAPAFTISTCVIVDIFKGSFLTKQTEDSKKPLTNDHIIVGIKKNTYHMPPQLMLGS